MHTCMLCYTYIYIYICNLWIYIIFWRSTITIYALKELESLPQISIYHIYTRVYKYIHIHVCTYLYMHMCRYMLYYAHAHINYKVYISYY